MSTMLEKDASYYGIRSMPKAAARTYGYQAVTVEIDVVLEAGIAESMAAGMAGVDAVWIENGPAPGRRVQLARKRGELRQVEAEEV